MMNKLITGGLALGAGTHDAKLDNAELVDILAAYRRRIAGNYRVLPSEDINKLPDGRMWLSSKLDGELWFLISWGEEVFLANPRGAVIYGKIPILDQARAIPDRTIIAGELHAIVEGRRARVGDLATMMVAGKNAETDKVCFSAFDIVQDCGNLIKASYDDKSKRLAELIKTSQNLRVVTTEEINTSEQIKQRYESEVVTGNVEGLIVRLESGLVYKLKPSISIDAAIVGYTVKSDQSNLVRSILLGLMRSDGRMQILGGCGNLGSEDNRKILFQELDARKTKTSIRYASESGSLYTFIRPELVAEVRVTDFQSERSDGSISQAIEMVYDASGWTSTGMRRSPRPIHPVFERLRADKSINITDIRFSQVADYLLSNLVETNLDDTLPTSEVLQREVWTKETKGQIAVRKLLIWKTNKETVDAAFPAYVVHWTDYSSGRGSPLNREVRLAPNHPEATKIADAMIEENIKKGWARTIPILAK